MSTKHYSEINENENGESVLKIPKILLEKLGWNEYTLLTIDINEDSNIVLSKKNEWTVEELQNDPDLVEDVINDTFKNKTVHYVSDKNNNKFVITPVDELNELEQLKEKLNDN